MLHMAHIVKDYRLGEENFRALDDVTLTVKKGEFLAVLGPSGSGKTTLMNIIGCLDVPTSGDYYLSGKPVKDQKEARLAQIRNKEIGFIFQSFYLLQKQTAYENVELPLIYANMPEKQRRERVEEMLEKVGLGDKMKNYPNQLSGGQQQRVAIARAIATNPTILLADEPTGALDQKTGAQVMELFHELNNEGRTIIMITHDSKIASHANRIVRILDGKLSEGRLEDA
ncbi:MAG: ABC transporter ATP-binding protein [Lachnospiraceae bacterium]|nr:ABC transporter ATP-binding protein [Lachnospiraceae bacterium]